MATLVIWMNKSLQLWSVERMNECGSTYSYFDTNPVSCVLQIPKKLSHVCLFESAAMKRVVKQHKKIIQGMRLIS